jgi:ABC-2 type transport system permease protein
LASTVVTITLQATILLLLGWLMGARYRGGFTGMLLGILPALILGTGFGGFSIALAIKVRKQETVIGAMNVLLLPLTFLSGAFMATNLIPRWMQAVAMVNPINWAIELARNALENQLWSYGSLQTFFLLIMFAVGSWTLVGWAFRSYQTNA